MHMRAVLFVHRHRWLVSIWFQFFFTFAFSFLGMVTGLLVLYLDHSVIPLPCYHFYTFPVVMIQGIVILVFLSILFLLLFRVGDAYAFKLEFSFILGWGSLALLMWAISFELSWRGPSFPFLWVSTAEIVFVVATIAFPVIASFRFTSVIRKSKRLIDEESISSTSSANDELLIVLRDDNFSNFFERYAVSSWAGENIAFHWKVEAFKDLPVDRLQAEARIIFQQFLAVGVFFSPPLSPQSPFH